MGLLKAGLFAISYGLKKGGPACCLMWACVREGLLTARVGLCKDVNDRYIKSACVRVGLLAISCFPDPV